MVTQKQELVQLSSIFSECTLQARINPSSCVGSFTLVVLETVFRASLHSLFGIENKSGLARSALRPALRPTVF